MNIILLGAPGSGKGTQANLLCEKNSFIQLSTGDLFRHHITNKTPLGIEAQKYTDQGFYVPDNITNGMVFEFLKLKNSNIIFDGYPRTTDQAQELNEMLKQLHQKIDKVIYIDLDDSILVDRLSGRLVCEKCKRSYHKTLKPPKVAGICDYDNTKLVLRSDDTLNKIKTRLTVYQEQTKPLTNFYQARIAWIDANNKTPIQVYENLQEILNL